VNRIDKQQQRNKQKQNWNNSTTRSNSWKEQLELNHLHRDLLPAEVGKLRRVQEEVEPRGDWTIQSMSRKVEKSLVVLKMP